MTVHTPMRADDVRRSYARWAGHYDFTFALFGRKYIKKVVNRLNDETHGNHVLDVGCGTGLSLPYFRPDLNITGIDISDDMLARSEQRARRRKLANIAGLHIMDAANMQFDAGQFDSVLVTFVMSVVPDPAQVLAEISRVTRPGGRVYLFNHFCADEEDNRVLAMAESAIAPASRKVGFHSDFCRSQLDFSNSDFHLMDETCLGPLDMFTLLVLKKSRIANLAQTLPLNRQTVYLKRMSDVLHIIGGGLAGSEAAWQAAEAGVQVVLHEMRPVRKTDAHVTDGLAELVCSNSFRSDDAETNAVGLLHAELRDSQSLIMASADAHQVPAGGALAVDREGFSEAVTAKIEAHPNITIKREEVTEIPADWQHVIVATGPLTSPALSETIGKMTGGDKLAFFDAIAPIIYRDSVDMDICWHQSRYDKVGPGGTGKDYINCPMDEAQYNTFLDALIESDTADFKEWEEKTPYFNGCLPIEVMAARGRDTLRHGPMKPRGLTNAHTPEIKPHAVVQLRQDNALGTLFNMVGFQTKLKYGAQTDVFRLIPGLEGARFARLGGLHRNTFLNSPTLLDQELRLKNAPHIRFAGQITGVEGYVESTTIGLMAGRFAAAQMQEHKVAAPPMTTAFGALLAHITVNADAKSFQPMNVNFGLMPDIGELPAPIGEDGKKLRGKLRMQAKKQARQRAFTSRARSDFESWRQVG